MTTGRINQVTIVRPRGAAHARERAGDRRRGRPSGWEKIEEEGRARMTRSPRPASNCLYRARAGLEGLPVAETVVNLGFAKGESGAFLHFPYSIE